MNLRTEVVAAKKTIQKQSQLDELDAALRTDLESLRVDQVLKVWFPEPDDARNCANFRSLLQRYLKLYWPLLRVRGYGEPYLRIGRVDQERSEKARAIFASIREERRQ